MNPKRPFLLLSKTQDSSRPQLAQEHVSESRFPTQVAQALGRLRNVLRDLSIGSSRSLAATLACPPRLEGAYLFVRARLDRQRLHAPCQPRAPPRPQRRPLAGHACARTAPAGTVWNQFFQQAARSWTVGSVSH